jgi:8-hydroxy-5-deazaflavin:NADPH oxidoreductase
MKIAVIGTGRMGTGLATGLTRAGHLVAFGSRNPDSAGESVQDSGAVGVTTYGEAVEGADVIVLAIPWVAVEQTLPQLGDLDGRIVVDITNPYVGGGIDPDINTTEHIQRWAPGARVVKGWNHVYASNLTRPDVDGIASSVFLAGDDPEAKDTVAALARDIGFEAVDVGGAEVSLVLTRLLAVMGGLRLGPDRPLKVLQRSSD